MRGGIGRVPMQGRHKGQSLFNKLRRDVKPPRLASTHPSLPNPRGATFFWRRGGNRSGLDLLSNQPLKRKRNWRHFPEVIKMPLCLCGNDSTIYTCGTRVLQSRTFSKKVLSVSRMVDGTGPFKLNKYTIQLLQNALLDMLWSTHSPHYEIWLYNIMSLEANTPLGGVTQWQPHFSGFWLE